MLGTIIGDIFWSVYDFKNYRGEDFNSKARYTDDTECTIAVADALANGVKPQKKLQE